MKSKTILVVAIGIVVLGVIYITTNENDVLDTNETLEGQDTATSEQASSIVTVVDEYGEEVVFDTSDWKTYENEEFEFSLRYPNEYEIYVPEINKSIRGNEYTIFLFTVRKKDALFDTGYSFSVDTELPLNARKFYQEELVNKPNEYNKYTLTTGSNKLFQIYSPKEGFASDLVFTDFKIGGYFLTAEMLEGNYTLAEFQAVLSTLEF